MEDGGGAEKSLEVRVAAALRARLNDFKDKADTLTLEGVRRVLEMDLGLKAMELDTHKKFIKQCMDKYFYAPSESTKHSEENPTETTQIERNAGMQNKFSLQSEFDGRNGLSSVSEDTKNTKDNKLVSLDEEAIKKAIAERAKYFQENSRNITMAGVRRLLEEDLKSERKSLDKFKDFIGKQLDEILSSEVVEPSNGTKESKSKKSASSQEGKGNKKPESTSDSDESANSEDFSDSAGTHNGSGDSDSEEVEVKERKKRNAREQKKMSAPVRKKQKVSSKASRLSGTARKKTEEHDGANDSEDIPSDSTMEESSKKKSEIPTPTYGKKVEHLKSVIKACGMSVPPSVYKRAKQAPDNKREAFLIKELEGILEKEGLSRNPSEKEIKVVRKNKERAKELEGIDLSNIVSSSRRRTTASFVSPKPPAIPSDDSEEEDEEDEEDTDDENSQSGGSSEGSEEEETSD